LEYHPTKNEEGMQGSGGKYFFIGDPMEEEE
jgi:hypothetical protein